MITKVGKLFVYIIFPISVNVFIILPVTQAMSLRLILHFFSFTHFPISQLLPKPVSFTNRIYLQPAHFFLLLLRHHNVRHNLLWHDNCTFANILAHLSHLPFSYPFSAKQFYPIDATASVSKSWETLKDITQCLGLMENNHWLKFLKNTQSKNITYLF